MSEMIGNGGHGNAVSLLQNNHQHSIRDLTIARLIVGKRHCRVLIVGNVNSDATGFDISRVRGGQDAHPTIKLILSLWNRPESLLLKIENP
ncbi:MULTISPECIES: hypothetical protein [unclassified Microcoleus]|uniref:hypothetical protein n=1 Tax=unclassified Microcoleus TaxID=2642155 RepID=UPI002FD6B1D7